MTQNADDTGNKLETYGTRFNLHDKQIQESLGLRTLAQAFKAVAAAAVENSRTQKTPQFLWQQYRVSGRVRFGHKRQ